MKSLVWLFDVLPVVAGQFPFSPRGGDQRLLADVREKKQKKAWRAEQSGVLWLKKMPFSLNLGADEDK